VKEISRLFESDCRECFLIAEVAQTHDGSLGQAHAFIDAAAEAGADAIKFQTHIANAESTPDEPFRVHFSRQDANRFNYWRRMEFSELQWKGLAEHALEQGLHFISSPFSFEALELLERVGVAAWKVASGEISNLPMLRRMSGSGLPVLLSTGISDWPEIDKAVQIVKTAGAPAAVFQTTTMYPTTPEKIGLNLLAEFRARYECPVGLSDHSGTIFPSLAAYVLGARFVEVHLTLSRRMFGPDVSSSVTVEELAQISCGLRFLCDAFSHPVDKDAQSKELGELRAMFRKSIVAQADLPAGRILGYQDLALKKPGTGMAPDMMESLIGKRLRRPVSADHPLQPDDIDDGN
jgi:N-acetylneuraminate synthase